MKTRLLDRFTELAALACVALAVFVLFYPPSESDAGGDLASLRVQEVQGVEGDAFRTSLAEARRLVDGGGDPENGLVDLVNRYPGRHEVWALSARHHEARGEEPAAMMDYARAVRLQPDYLDDGSPLFLGARIEGVTDRELTRLREKKSAEGLTGEERKMIKAAYFLVRRLAGGCE
jgi:hypothetical protein